MKWFCKLFCSGETCNHKWETIKVQEVQDQTETVIGTNVILQCTKCGNMKNTRV